MLYNTNEAANLLAMELANRPFTSVTVPVSEFRANCGPLLEAVRDGQEIIITKNGRPVAEVRPPRSPRAEPAESLFGFCRDIIALPEGFDFDEVGGLPEGDEVIGEVLASWQLQEPELVVEPLELDG